jgi:carbon starvation protein CstA
MGLDQNKAKNRLILCVPLLGIGAFLGFGNTFGFIDYSIIWRYFSWTNQTLAMIVLWAASMYLFMEKKNYWITVVPATFMSAVSATYFVMAPECLGLIPALKNNTLVAYPVGVIVALLFLCLFIMATKRRKNVTMQEKHA